MELKDRISATLDYADLSASAFAKKIGVKTTQAIYDLLSGKTRTLSSDILNKVVSCYPMLSVEWLMTGEGDMIKPSVQQTSYGDHSPNVNGDGNHFGGCASIDRAFTTLDNSLAQNAAMLRTLDAALAEIAAQRELVAQSMAQTAMLIQLLQNQK